MGHRAYITMNWEFGIKNSRSNKVDRILLDWITYKLENNEEYRKYLGFYLRVIRSAGLGTTKHPHNRNMMKALRLHPWHNTPEDWARLHAYELGLRELKRFKRSLASKLERASVNSLVGK